MFKYKAMLCISVALLITVCFQNCSSVNFTSSPVNSSLDANGDPNGPGDNGGVDPSNPVALLEPALAIRGMGCIQCHAQVASTVITDFGYRGDGASQDYYFNKNISASYWKVGAVYGDDAINFNTMQMGAGNP
jgi:hypothetical protein